MEEKQQQHKNERDREGNRATEKIYHLSRCGGWFDFWARCGYTITLNWKLQKKRKYRL